MQTFLFGQRAMSIIQDHSPSTPLFLYVPWNAVHNNVAVPDGWNTTEIAKVIQVFGIKKNERRFISFIQQ